MQQHYYNYFLLWFRLILLFDKNEWIGNLHFTVSEIAVLMSYYFQLVILIKQLQKGNSLI